MATLCAWGRWQPSGKAAFHFQPLAPELAWEASAAMFSGKKTDNTHDVHGYIAQWLKRLTADQQVPSSNLGVPFAIILLNKQKCWRHENKVCATKALHVLWEFLV